MHDFLKDKLLKIVQSDFVKDLEDRIASKINCTIYRENLPLLVSFMVEEVIQSEVSIDELLIFIHKNSAAIEEFAENFLKDQSPKSLSMGITITYAIYLIYLDHKNDELLEAYIKRRKIPNANKFALQLKKVKEIIG